MKKGIFYSIFSVMLLVACGKGNESHTEHDGHQHEEATQHEEIVKPDLSKVKVVNEIDPICEMETTKHINDTINYKGQTYGFCSTHCKTEFKKDPEKYISSLNKK